MNKDFDYEEVFMGLSVDSGNKILDPQQIYNEDYRLRYLVESVCLKKGKMLDIGSGGGTLTESLTYYYPEFKIFGCDVSQKAIRLAKQHGKGKVKYAQIKKQKLPYRDNFFDVVLCLDVMEHVPDIHFFTKEIKRVLKKNGLFFLAVPCEGQFFTYTWLFQKIGIGQKLTFKHFGHIHPEFTHKYIMEFLRKYKFFPVKKLYGDHLLYQVTNLIQYFLAKELLELFFGTKRAEAYYDRSLVNDSRNNNPKPDFIMFMRIIWFKIWDIINHFIDLERILMKDISFSSWKLFLLTQNNK